MDSPSTSPGITHSTEPDAQLAQARAGSLPDVAGDFDIDQILYCSLLNEPMDEAAIGALTQSAANLNRMDHITGMLMHADGVFVQLIEGPRQAVNHLWARLLRDKRHRGIVQLYHRREVEMRVCSDWNMKYVQHDDLRALIHEAKEEIVAGRKSAWAPAIERMDFLLSNSNWDSFVLDFKKAA
jgi:hypothetical protein